MAGPYDPEVCRLIRQNSIRAKFGIDKIKNAIHVTDLPEDGILEVDYFFNILQNIVKWKANFFILKKNVKFKFILLIRDHEINYYNDYDYYYVFFCFLPFILII